MNRYVHVYGTSIITRQDKKKLMRKNEKTPRVQDENAAPIVLRNVWVLLRYVTSVNGPSRTTG